MRLVPINSIKDGTILAKTIYNTTGIPLLRAGYPLNDKLIVKAINNGISSLYIQDSYSDEIITDIISPEFRQKAVQTLKNSFKDMHRKSLSKVNPTNNSSDPLANIAILANEIVDNIFTNKDVVINLVDIKTMDDYTYQHCVNTAVLAIVLGIELGYKKKQLQSIAIGALLHDFGKVFIPKTVLLKPGKLSDQEFDLIRNHPTLGHDYLHQHLSLDPITLSIISEHHEKVDGTGYPNRLNSRRISIFAKIIAVCDVYDALTSDRSYRKAMSPNEALELIMGSCGIDFDLDIVRAFIKRIVPYPVGTLVNLSNQRIAVIKEINPHCVLRPIVKVINHHCSEITFTEVDLLTHTTVVIEGIYREDDLKLENIIQI
ncbi:HD domain-containing protein [Alkalibaculum sp. M08DMB]|uniref:HD domain-containing protein n=1 Tax=Alkalibaculum sporogenes TaxID=2655001 RepID=A0A6A7K5W7_9FIRM|nr:HD-GYP domain-containing protein [Alkalibaculum sporogenes]MPW24754.1 HD domain-containing protein [Alkalibaculum sporogenes]